MLVLHPDINTEHDFEISERKYLIEIVDKLTKEKTPN